MPDWAMNGVFAQLGVYLEAVPAHEASLLASASMREMGQPYGRLDAMAGGVAIVAKGRIWAHGECSCGWRGSEHVISAVAIHDALIHAATERCELSVPLVW
jgi:hypothetical protein